MAEERNEVTSTLGLNIALQEGIEGERKSHGCGCRDNVDGGSGVGRRRVNGGNSSDTTSGSSR